VLGIFLFPVAAERESSLPAACVASAAPGAAAAAAGGGTAGKGPQKGKTPGGKPGNMPWATGGETELIIILKHCAPEMGPNMHLAEDA